MKDTLKFIIGSHMYGLNTVSSDVDLLKIYFDYADYVRISRKRPLVQETENNNTKLYSLDYFASLLIKGNPNLIEVLNLKSVSPVFSAEQGVIYTFLEGCKYLEPHSGIPKAYLGHLNHLRKEIYDTPTKGPTEKRVSHGVRVLLSLDYMLENKKTVDFRVHPENSYVKQIKTGQIPISEGIEFINTQTPIIEEKYKDIIGSFPDKEPWIEYSNNFFVVLYV